MTAPAAAAGQRPPDSPRVTRARLTLASAGSAPTSDGRAGVPGPGDTTTQSYCAAMSARSAGH